MLPAWFVYPEDPSVQLLTAIYHDKPAERMASLGNHQFEVIGRLRPGVTADQASADLAVIARRVHDAHLDMPIIGKSAVARPLLEDMVVDARRPLYVLFAATLCVLLIACLNVANLLVARGTARRKEQAIRMALGGGRLRLLREHLMESVLLSAAGGAAGMALAWAAIGWLVHTRADLSRADAIHIDGVVVAFTAGIIVLCALFAGVVGSMASGDDRVLATLQESSRGASAGQGRVRLRKALLALEVGLTVVLLVGAGLLLKSYERLRSSDMGCVTDNVLTMRISLFGGRYNDRATKVNFFSELLSRIRALPGVEGAGIVQAVPGQGYWGDGPFTIVEHPPLPAGETQLAVYRWADPGYFAALGIPILRGRSFDAGKRLDGADEVVISRSFAEQHLPGEDPIGKHLRVDDRVRTIVGVVGDTRYVPSEDPVPTDYLPLNTGFPNYGTLVIRSAARCRSTGAAGREDCAIDGPRSACVRRDDHGSAAGQVDGRREFRRDAAGGVCGGVIAAGRGWAFWRALLHRGAAHERDRHSHRSRRAARTGDAQGVAGWIAAGIAWASAWPGRQCGCGEGDCFDALWNGAARCGGLRGRQRGAAAGGCDGLCRPRLARVAARPGAGAADGVK